MLIFQPLAITERGFVFKNKLKFRFFLADFGFGTNSGSGRVRVLTLGLRQGSGLQKLARLQLCCVKKRNRVNSAFSQLTDNNFKRILRQKLRKIKISHAQRKYY